MSNPRRNIELLMLGVGSSSRPSDHSINGITRFQKLLFLLANEEAIPEVSRAFEFTPYKAGPYSSRLYDDLELLENLDLVESESTAAASEPERAELQALRYEELLGEGEQDSASEGADSAEGADTYEEKRYRLTEKGQRHVQDLMVSGKYQASIDGIRRVKSKYVNYSLNDLLRHVYTKYPEMATESEIKEKVLRRRS